MQLLCYIIIGGIHGVLPHCNDFVFLQHIEETISTSEFNSSLKIYLVTIIIIQCSVGPRI